MRAHVEKKMTKTTHQRQSSQCKYIYMYIHIHTGTHIYIYAVCWRCDTFIAKFSKFQHQQPQRLSKINKKNKFFFCKTHNNTNKGLWQPRSNRPSGVSYAGAALGRSVGVLCEANLKQRQRSAAHTENGKCVEQTNKRMRICMYGMCIYACVCVTTHASAWKVEQSNLKYLQCQRYRKMYTLYVCMKKQQQHQNAH